MKKSYLKYGFYVWFTIVPLLCVFLDLIFSTIQPDPEYGDYTTNFDFSIINQSIYLSVWISLATFVYGLFNWINIHTKNMPSWITGKNNLTRITALNVLAFILYNVNLLVSTNVVGFNTWYKIIKSVFEHMVTPLLIIGFYFIFITPIINSKDYFKKYSWYNIIHLAIYLFYVLLRAIILTSFPPHNQEVFTPFPYEQLDPRVVGYPLVILGVGALFVGIIVLATGLNYLSNLRNSNTREPAPPKSKKLLTNYEE